MFLSVQRWQNLAFWATVTAVVAIAAHASWAVGQSASADSIRGFEGLYDNLDKFKQETAPCVVLIDPTDPEAVAKNVARPGGLYHLRRLEGRITALSGLECRCFHYTQLKRDSLERPHVKAIVLRAPAPAGQLKCDAAREELWAMLRQTKIPTIAFCGGFHQLYMAYGGTCADMRRLRPGETDPHPSYQPGWLKEWGFTPIKLTKRDPLFEGLGRQVTMLEQHVSECKELPREFEVLASSEHCPIQAIKHRTKPLYGTQFHPEAYEEDNLEGKQLLLNFFRIAQATGNLSKP